MSWSNVLHKLHKLRAVSAALVTAGALAALSPAWAQDQQPQQAQQQERLSDQQLQQLVAPIALYPDPLLAQILTASTYPLEVVMAARWSKDNPNLKGKDLENVMQQQPWDPSVKGLTAVPQVLTMMNDKLDWTQQLGEAFLAQPEDITKAVQALRTKAEATGNLKSGKELRVKRVATPPPPSGEVVVVPEYIAIEPIEPEVIYVPVYDPVVVYGVGYWPAAYVPFFWYPPWWTVGPVWGFWPAVYVGPALWCNYNWGYGYVHINVVQFNHFNHTHLASAGGPMKWNFNQAHHSGTFKNVALQQKFGNLNANHNLKNTNLNLKHNTNLNLNPNLNAGNKNKLGNQNIGNKNLGNKNLGNKNLGNKNIGNKNLGNKNNKVSSLNAGKHSGSTKNVHTNPNTGNKNKFVSTGHQNRINQSHVSQPKFNQQKFSNTQNFNRVQSINRGPIGGGGGGGGPKNFNAGGQGQRHH